jgi:uncharacterized protein
MTTAKFISACSTGKVDAVLSHIEAGIGTDVRDGYSFTGLIWAGRKGHVAVAKALLEHGADIEAHDVRGRTALFHAVTYQRYELVEFLAKSAANVNPVDSDGWTPLDFSHTSRHAKMFGLLQRLGAKHAFHKA